MKKVRVTRRMLEAYVQKLLAEAPAPDNNDPTYNAAVKFQNMTKREDVQIEKKEFASTSDASTTFFNSIVNPAIVSKLGSPSALRQYLTDERGKNFALLSYSPSASGTSTAVNVTKSRAQSIIGDPASRSVPPAKVRETTISHPVFYLDPDVTASSEAQKYILDAIVSADAGAIGNFYEQFSSQVILPQFSDAVTSISYSNAYNLNSSTEFPSNMPSVDLYLGNKPPGQLNLIPTVQASPTGSTITIPGVCLSGKCSTGSQIYSKLEGLKIIKVFAQLLKPDTTGYGDLSKIMTLFENILVDRKLEMNYSFSTGGLKSPAKTTAEFGPDGDVSGAGTTSENLLNAINVNISLTSFSNVGEKLIRSVGISTNVKPSATDWDASWIFAGVTPAVSINVLEHELGLDELADYTDKLSTKIADNVINEISSRLNNGTLITVRADGTKKTAADTSGAEQQSYVLGKQNQVSDFFIKYVSANPRGLTSQEKSQLGVAAVNSIIDVVPEKDIAYDSSGVEITGMTGPAKAARKANRKSKQKIKDNTILWLSPYLDKTSNESTDFAAFIKANCIAGMSVNATANPKYYTTVAKDLSSRPTAASVPGLTCYLSEEALLTLERSVVTDSANKNLIKEVRWSVKNKNNLEIAYIRQYSTPKLSATGESIVDNNNQPLMEDRVEGGGEHSSNWSGTSTLLANPKMTTVATFFPAVNAGNVGQIVRASNQNEADFVNALAKVYTAGVFNALSPYKPVVLPTRLASSGAGSIRLVKKIGSNSYEEDTTGSTLFEPEQTFGQASSIISSVSQQIRTIMGGADFDKPPLQRLAMGFADIMLGSFPSNYRALQPDPGQATTDEEEKEKRVQRCANFIGQTVKSVFESQQESEEQIRAALLGCLAIRTTQQFRDNLVTSLDNFKPNNYTPPPDWSNQLLGDRYTGELPSLMPENILRTNTLEIFNVVIATIKFVDGLSMMSLPIYGKLKKLVSDISNDLVEEFSKYSLQVASESRLYESILLDLMKASGKKQRAQQQPKKIKLTRRQLQELMRRQLK